MEDIARTAGVGVGTVYRHFPTKEELIAARVRDRFERLTAGNMPELNWQRYVEIMLDGLRAPGHNELPPPRAVIPR